MNRRPTDHGETVRPRQPRRRRRYLGKTPCVHCGRRFEWHEPKAADFILMNGVPVRIGPAPQPLYSKACAAEYAEERRLRKLLKAA